MSFTENKALTKKEVEDGKKSKWIRIQLTGYLQHMPIKICRFKYLTTLIITNNLFQYLPQEICQLDNLVNLDASHNFISVLPLEMGYMYQLTNVLLSDNQISELPYTFGFLHGLKTLDLRFNPLTGQTLRYYDYDLGARKLINILMEQYYMNYTVAPPPNRDWHIVEQSSGGLTFSLMSYNILCPRYCNGDTYRYSPKFSLDWEYRKKGILEEMIKYEADIICIQEMETSAFESFFSVELKKRNYDGIFIAKSRHRIFHASDQLLVDGCAIFWKMHNFEKVHHFNHEFVWSSESLMENPAPELQNRVMNRDNVALSVILEVKGPGMERRRICVSTGHIHWDPLYSDVKVIQTLFWTSELWDFIQEFYRSENQNDRHPIEMPVIFCGDFNSLPESAVVDYLLQGKVELSHEDFRNLGHKYMFDEWKDIRQGFFDNGFLRHNFKFDRAYQGGPDNGMRWSNYTFKFRGIIDHIFHSKGCLKVLSQLKQIPESWFDQERIVGSPHAHIYSDHFSLLVKFELLQSQISPDGRSTITKDTISKDIREQRGNCASTMHSNVNALS